MTGPIRYAILLMLMTEFAAATDALAAAATDWNLPASPYRVPIALDRTINDAAEIDIDANHLLECIAAVAVDQINNDTFAFERTVVVNPRTGKTVGRFALRRMDEPFAIDGDFRALQHGTSPWSGLNPADMTIETIDIHGASRPALMMQQQLSRDDALTQPVQLIAGARYLLEYWLMMDPAENEIGVIINDPTLDLFPQQPHSYINKMPPRGQWTKIRAIFQPKVERARLEVRPVPTDAFLQGQHTFVGRAGVAAMRLQRVRWRLIVEPDEPVDALMLYAVARAGHRFAAVTADMIADEPPAQTVGAQLSNAQMQPLNPAATRAVSGNVAAWTIDPTLPMKVGALRRYDPGSTATDAATVTLFDGGSQSLVIAINAGQPRIDDLQATSDLPADVTFARIATVPVYDGPTVDGEVKGKLIETRYDPMVPLDYKLDPDSADGMHLIVATITPRPDTAPGNHRGHVTLRFADHDVTIPVHLRVTGITLKPKRHFGTLFGGIYFVIANPKGYADMADDCLSIAQYHGMRHGDLTPRTIMSLSIPDTPDPRMTPYRRLAERYFNVMLDHHLLPQSPALYAYFTYDVVDRGQDEAPSLRNWDFGLGYDDAIEQFVIERDMPWLVVGRSNGSLMHKITLNNGVTYSVRPNPDPNNPAWMQLTREQFNQLLGDYWDTFAKHLDKLGVLDRAIFVIDETQPETYDDVRAYILAMRSRPHARQIKVGHTTYKTSSYVRRGPDGALLMDELLDVPMPDNDEHFNFYEPEWHARYERPGKRSWVYYVETDHMNLENAGLSTTITPLKLRNLGVSGWYCWEAFVWSLSYAYVEGAMGGYKYRIGPVINPWKNPFYHHGPGVLSYFYPPDPRGLAKQPTDLIIPSYRLTLMRDGIQYRALLEALRAGRDDAGRTLQVDAGRIEQIERELATLWPDNPVQWYIRYQPYRDARRLIDDLAAHAIDAQGGDH